MPQRGKDFIYLVQSVNATIGSDALLPGFQTEGTFGSEKELIDEQTKSGRAVAVSNRADNVELTLFSESGDEGQEAIEQSYEDDLNIKIWRVNTKLNANGKHDARFGYGVLENLEFSEPTDGFVEMSTTVQILNKMVKGELDPLPQALLDALQQQYDFETPGETGKPATP